MACLVLVAGHAMGQEKPKLAVLNIESSNTQPEATGRISENLPNAFLSSKNFQLAEVPVLKKVAEEWAMPSLLSEREKADKLGEKHQLDLLVSGNLVAFTKKGWLVTFVIMNSQARYRTRKQMLGYKGEFYSYLSEKDPGLADALAGMRKFFHIPTPATVKKRGRKKPPEALSGVEVKNLIEGKTVQATGSNYIQYRQDGKWAVSTEADGYFEERGKWWIEGHFFCVEVPKMEEPFCRYMKKVDGGYRMVLSGGAEQDISLQ
jgi:hypothetical protein